MRVELLAPGSSFESVIAAYNAGADAVYTGGELFGARASANNLSEEELIEAMNYAHLHNRKLYLTVNTLLKDKELEEKLIPFLEPLYKAGLDAVIVQDVGVIQKIREVFPQLDIHGSTQMTIAGKDTALALKELGLKRIVTPRELSLNEIQDIHNNVDIEIESFVHGALCYCYSGQCFLSSYIGGRSGNRGRCAQPCRMEYDVISKGKVLNQGNAKYVLSPKDICAINILPEIIESGVYSLKIEGRMRKTEYITGVVSIYRKYLDLYLNNPDNYAVEDKDYEKLLDLFNRNGFSESYYKQHNGRNMISLKKPEFRTSNEQYIRELKEKYLGKKLKEKLDLKVVFKQDTEFIITTTINNEIIKVTGNRPGFAINKPVTMETIEKHLRKTGNTDFQIDNIEFQYNDNLFIPIGEINELRRNLLEKVEDYILSPYKRTSKQRSNILEPFSKNKAIRDQQEINITNTRDQQSKDEIKSSVLISKMEQLSTVLKKNWVTNIYIELTAFKEKEIEEIKDRIKNKGKKSYIAMPFMLRKKDKETIIKEYGNIIRNSTNFLIRNIEEYYYIKKYNKEAKFILDYHVYTFNKRAKDFYNDENIIKITAPLELNNRELEERSIFGDEFIVYGYMPAMITAGCGLKTTNHCNNANLLYNIKDKKNNSFTVQCVCKFCYNVIYNSKPLSLMKFKNEIKKLNPDSVRLNFTVEGETQVNDILDKFEKTFIKGELVVEDDRTTRGHFRRGVL